jgi:hypothetical protein
MRPLILFLVVVGGGCASTRWQRGRELEALGDPRGAAESYESCAREEKNFDCAVRLAQLLRPGGPLKDCARFIALTADVRARHGNEEGFKGPHVRDHIVTSWPAAWEIESVAEWFTRTEADCRLRTEERAETLDLRKRRVLDHPCPRHTEEDVERLDAKAASRVAVDCERFRRDHLSDDGTDEEMDAAIARGLSVGAVAQVEESFAAPCWERPALKKHCPSREALVARLQKRVKMLIAFGTAVERLRWAKHYIKRWPDGADIGEMRTLRERASIDLALEQPPAKRVEMLEEFLRTWPESPLRDEAEREIKKAK